MNRKAKALFVLGLIFFLVAGVCGSVVMAAEHGGPAEVTAHGGEGGHGETAEHHGYGRAEWMDLLFRAINFFLFAFIIVKFTAKPLANALRQRENKIETTLAELEEEKEKARKVHLEYEAKLAQLDKEKERIIQEFISIGEKEKEKIIEEAKKMAEQIKEGAKKAAEQEVRTVKQQLRAEVAEMAAQLAAEVIKQNFKPEDQKKIVEEYLSKMS